MPPYLETAPEHSIQGPWVVITPEEMVGKRIAVGFSHGDSFRMLSGIGAKKEEGNFGVECEGFAFFFDKRFWPEFDIRRTGGGEGLLKNHDYLIIIKRDDSNPNTVEPTASF